MLPPLIMNLLSPCVVRHGLESERLVVEVDQLPVLVPADVGEWPPVHQTFQRERDLLLQLDGLRIGFLRKVRFYRF
jgi:hypothetical protein